MSSTATSTNTAPEIPFTVITPMPATAKEAWNTPIFTPPDSPEDASNHPGRRTEHATEPVSLTTLSSTAVTPAVMPPATTSPATTSPAIMPPAVAVPRVAAPAAVSLLPGSVAEPTAMVLTAEDRLAESVGTSAPVADLATVECEPTEDTHHLGSLPQSEEPDAGSGKRGYVRGETCDVWGLKLDCVTMDEALNGMEAMIQERTPRYVITANLNYAMLLDRDASLQTVTDNASMILADGQPLVWRSRFNSTNPLPQRVAGSELIYRLAKRAAAAGWRIYFLGAEPGVAQRCADRLAKRYRGLQVAGVQSPPYRKLTAKELRDQRQQILDANADILLVAFGQPKGERWIYENYQALGIPVSIQLGASFDFVAGTAQRAPKIWSRFGMEWFFRMACDPKRLVPRYFNNARFLMLSLIRDWRDFVNQRYGA